MAHSFGGLSPVLSLLCLAGAVACGGTSSGPATDSAVSGETSEGTTDSSSAGPATSDDTTGSPSEGTTVDTVSTGVPTTGDPTAPTSTTDDTTVSTDATATDATDSDTTDGTTDGVSSTTDDDTTDGTDTSTTTDSTTDSTTDTTTGDPDPWNCQGGEPITVNGAGKYSTLAAAVAAAPPDATITVCPGTYQEGVVIDRPMTLLGAGQGSTFLDGGDTTTQIFIDAVSVTIEGFTFQHGKAVYDPLGNSKCGGAVAIDHSFGSMTVTIRDSTFTDNHGQYGGAICSDSSSDTNAPQKLVLENVTIVGNTAMVNGGGIFSYASTTMTNTTITGNTAGNDGGGIYFSYSNNTVVGGAVKQNTAGGGGGMFLQSPVKVDVTTSDWGFGQAEENTPNDVEHYVNEYGFFGDNVSFNCNYPEWNQGTCSLK